MKQVSLALLLFLSALSAAWAAGNAPFSDVGVTGIVTDADGEPVAGATVVVDGHAQMGTATDIFGNLMYRRAYQPRHKVWPIPLVEMERNRNLVQNEGW